MFSTKSFTALLFICLLTLSSNPVFAWTSRGFSSHVSYSAPTTSPFYGSRSSYSGSSGSYWRQSDSDRNEHHSSGSSYGGYSSSSFGGSNLDSMFRMGEHTSIPPVILWSDTSNGNNAYQQNGYNNPYTPYGASNAYSGAPSYPGNNSYAGGAPNGQYPNAYCYPNPYNNGGYNSSYANSSAYAYQANSQQFIPPMKNAQPAPQSWRNYSSLPGSTGPTVAIMPPARSSFRTCRALNKNRCP